MSRVQFGAQISQSAIATMTREERAKLLGVHVEVFDEARAAFMRMGRPCAGAIQEAAPGAKLFDLKQAARKLGISEDQTRGLIEDGELQFINLGRGKIRPRMRFTETDLDDLIERRRRKNTPCLSTSRKSHHITSMTSKSEAVGFMARRNAQLAKTPKSSKR
jgi:excisionase family DNA binding protein